jgi:hypothetical protein
VTGSNFVVSYAIRTQAAAVLFLFVEEYRNKADCGFPTGDQITNGGTQFSVPTGKGTGQTQVFWPGSGYPAGWLAIGARLLPGNLPDNTDISRFQPTYATFCYQFDASPRSQTIDPGTALNPVAIDDHRFDTNAAGRTYWASSNLPGNRAQARTAHRPCHN